MRLFIHMAYRGAPFHGWQRQPQEPTVQSVTERAFATLLRLPHVEVTGAGRTDAGVNARMMIAHVDIPDDAASAIKADSSSFLRSLNALTGRDIAIYSLTEVASDAHARFDATARTYRYFVHTGKDPFAGALSWQAPPTLDFEAMNTAAALLLGRHDFTSFAKLHSDTKTNICTVTSAAWHAMGARRFFFEITADRFLRNMVRAVVGTLVDVGRHKTEPTDIIAVRDSLDRCSAGTSMPGEPLFLWNIEYPYYEAAAPL